MLANIEESCCRESIFFLWLFFFFFLGSAPAVRWAIIAPPKRSRIKSYLSLTTSWLMKMMKDCPTLTVTRSNNTPIQLQIKRTRAMAAKVTWSWRYVTNPLVSLFYAQVYLFLSSREKTFFWQPRKERQHHQSKDNWNHRPLPTSLMRYMRAS